MIKMWRFPHKFKNLNSHINNHNSFLKLISYPFSWKKVNIPIEKLQISFSRSSGAGGQNVNKLETKVEFRFNVNKADWLSLDIKNRLRELYPNKINNEGEFFLTSQENRTQEENKKEAEKKLQMIIHEASQPKKERIMEPIVETDHARSERIRDKKNRSKIKSMRQNRDD